jgi:hypothetical protein
MSQIYQRKPVMRMRIDDDFDHHGGHHHDHDHSQVLSIRMKQHSSGTVA